MATGPSHCRNFTAHEKISKAMDANKDGVLTPEETQAFTRGTSKLAAQRQHDQEQEEDD